MQAYFDEEIRFSDIRNNYLEINFYGNNFNSEFQNKTYNEFKSDKHQDMQILKRLILEKKPLGIIVKGGEPLLQRQALLFLFRFCKNNNIRTTIKTNLSKPNTLKSLLKYNLIDEIFAKIITDKKGFQKITKCDTFFKNSDEIYNDIIKSLKLLKKEKVKIKFITEIIPGHVFRKETFLEIAELINDFNSLWILKRFNPELYELKFKSIDPPSNNFIENIKEIIKNRYKKIVLEIN
jgi:pyruvate-formate lyase-activating enzyme